MATTMFSSLVLVGIICLCNTEPLKRHKRSWIIDSFDIVEEHPGPFPYELGQIKLDRSYLVEFMLKGKGVDEDPKGVLSIDSSTGVIKVHRKVDFEQYSVLMLTFQARNKSNLAIDTQLGMEVNILDINDNPPIFQRKVYDVTINEAAKQGGFVVGVLAIDKDAAGTLNSTIDYKIISVTPATKNTEFYIQDSGAISFKGCLDYEVANKYTIIVEAKDRGEVVKLSSTATIFLNIQDGNNHLPVITGQTGSGNVVEGTKGISPLKIHTTDTDTRLTPAWRVRYSIQGDKGGHFSIHTDPDTNDGILTVIKPLDFEEQAEQKFTIFVENEESYFSCEVKARPADGLWTVITNPSKPSSINITITVEDENDPPYFPDPKRKVIIEENGVIGAFVDRVTAVDPDTGRPHKLEYSIEQDPAGWFRVDKTTGEIFVKEALDRESSHVTNGTYTVTVLVTEKDDHPPMTSTATIQIHIEDKNDNVPLLKENTVSVCQSDEVSSTEITAYDPDGDPYSGPFSFEVIGDHKDKWSFDPSHGYTVHLVKDKSVHASLYTLIVKISDKQGRFVLQNLSVAACDCAVSPNCLLLRNTQQTVGSGVIGITIFAVLMILASLLLSLTCSCGTMKSLVEVDNVLGDALLPSNIEKPGTDCVVPNILLKKTSVSQSKEATLVNNGVQQTSDILQVSSNVIATHSLPVQVEECWSKDRSQYSSEKQAWMWKQIQYQSENCYRGSTFSRRSSQRRQSAYFISRSTLQSLLSQRLHSIQSQENELLDYKPQIYTFEDNSDNFADLDPIDMPINEFDPELFSDLGPAFKHLASICNPGTR
ncbi:cadherin-like protein 26 isoform X1 [Megalobrama amblycephala]|uniref:cadherin-like protein 26 isoform X1 n=1 Tax=Megalobrama amblycephala TaxID=75352 RepID=UPI0020141703|nr:cadherin-like protein 26 isoform X1 [Megalobrama amblycephala]